MYGIVDKNKGVKNLEQRDSRYVELYSTMWELYCEWLHSEESDVQIEEEHCWQYKYSPALGMYKEGDMRLLSCLDDDYPDDRILDVVVLDFLRLALGNGGVE